MKKAATAGRVAVVCLVCGGPVRRAARGRPRLYDRRACRDVAWRSGAARRGREGREERLRTAVATAMRQSRGA